MEYFTNVPEVDALILDQMEDYDLINYCQSHENEYQLCLIPRIKRRVDLYQRYKTFDISSIFDNIENYTNYPILIHRYFAYEDDQLFVLNDDIHIFKQNNYTKIKYFSTIDDEESYMIVNINNLNNNILLNQIINSYDDNINTIWSLDLRSTYHIYQSIGLQKYAREETIKQLDIQYNLKQRYQSNIVTGFYFLFSLYLWFKTQCMLYGLIDDHINVLDLDVDEEYITSEAGQQTNLIINNDIDDMFQLLYQFVLQL
jgi:hypothetical protein